MRAKRRSRRRRTRRKGRGSGRGAHTCPNNGFLAAGPENPADKNLSVDTNLKGVLPVIIRKKVRYWVSCYMGWDYVFPRVFTTIFSLNFIS